ncbi:MULTISPECIES: hypothetical protein [unclassified Actinotalea]|uniref:hypothetical protein n=1 Tax=unclassified Actinotalea TaxID=2638618 RepID=UPI0015F3DD5A|nr:MULTISPECIES: hypothetical protein [unclassified Actinotalea]
MASPPGPRVRPPGGAVRNRRQESPVLDLVFVAASIAVFALVAVVGRGVATL